MNKIPCDFRMWRSEAGIPMTCLQPSLYFYYRSSVNVVYARCVSHQMRNNTGHTYTTGLIHIEQIDQDFYITAKIMLA